MSIKHTQESLKISKSKIIKRECSAKEMTILFSFRHITSCTNYNFSFFNKQKKNSILADSVVQLFEKLNKISQITWDEFYGQSKKSGIEYINISEMDKSFINHLDFGLQKDEKLIVIRFNGQGSRFIVRRGTKCSRVAHFLGIDCDLELYKH